MAKAPVDIRSLARAQTELAIRTLTGVCGSKAAYVIMLEGSVVLEMEGKPPQTFTAGQAFQEPPDVVHTFRNASTTEPAKAIGIQYVGKGQPLQADNH